MSDWLMSPLFGLALIVLAGVWFFLKRNDDPPTPPTSPNGGGVRQNQGGTGNIQAGRDVNLGAAIDEYDVTASGSLTSGSPSNEEESRYVL